MAMDALALRAYWGQWDMRNLRILVPSALVGTVLGLLTFRYLSSDGLRVLVAVVSLIYGARYFLARVPEGGRTPTSGAGFLWGATSGFTSFSIHAGGPPLQAFLIPQQLDRTTFQATGVAFFFIVNWSKVLPYAWLGQWNTDNLDDVAGAAPARAAGRLSGPHPPRPDQRHLLLPRHSRVAAGDRREAPSTTCFSFSRG